MEENLLSVFEFIGKGVERYSKEYLQPDITTISSYSVTCFTVSITIPESVLSTTTADGPDTVQNITVNIDLPFRPFLQAVYRSGIQNKQYVTGGSFLEI